MIPASTALPVHMPNRFTSRGRPRRYVLLTQLYICEICGEETLLDTSTINELTALASTVIKLPSKQKETARVQNSTGTATGQKRKETQQPR